MVDIHCHILPGWTMGPLYGGLAADGPHGGGLRRHGHHRHAPLQSAGGRPEELPLRRPAHGLFPAAAGPGAGGHPLRIHPGAEVFCTPELPELLDRRQLQTLGGGRYLLVEFYFDESAEFMEQCFHQIRTRGLTPVAAHPERYKPSSRTPYMVRRWFERGVVIQLNKGSILGRLGRRAQDTALWLLERGWLTPPPATPTGPPSAPPIWSCCAAPWPRIFPRLPPAAAGGEPPPYFRGPPLVGTDEPIFSPREDEL